MIFLNLEVFSHKIRQNSQGIGVSQGNIQKISKYKPLEHTTRIGNL